MATRVVIWIDHHEARIFNLHPRTADEITVVAERYHFHRHPKGLGEPPEHPDDDRRFFENVAEALAAVDEILIVGPSSAKLEFFRHLQAHAPRLESKVVGIETVDHPTDGEIVARARISFKKADQLV
jgi:hypothetical protein